MPETLLLKSRIIWHTYCGTFNLFDFFHMKSKVQISLVAVVVQSLSRILLFQPNCSPPGSSVLCPWDSPNRNTGVGCHFLLQGIFLTQGSNPGLLIFCIAGSLLNCRGNSLLTEPPGKLALHISSDLSENDHGMDLDGLGFSSSSQMW